MIENQTKEIAIKFSNLIIEGNFEEAYQLTATFYQKETSLEQMIEEYKNMIESYGFMENSFELDEINSSYEGQIYQNGVLVDVRHIMKDIQPGESEDFPICFMVTVNGIVVPEETPDDQYETYTVFDLVFTTENGQYLIDTILFDGRA